MRTATSKKGAAKPIPLATKKVAINKSITTISKTKKLKTPKPREFTINKFMNFINILNLFKIIIKY